MKLNIKKIAEEKGMNRTDLSRRAEVHASTVSRVWKDPETEVDSKIEYETLKKIATALGVTVPDLIAEE